MIDEIEVHGADVQLKEVDSELFQGRAVPDDETSNSSTCIELSSGGRDVNYFSDSSYTCSETFNSSIDDQTRKALSSHEELYLIYKKHNLSRQAMIDLSTKHT